MVFNIFGLLINLGWLVYVIFGVFLEVWVLKLVEVFDVLGMMVGFVVYGVLGEGCGIDEFMIVMLNCVCGVGWLCGIDGMWDVCEYGFFVVSFDDFKGGDFV